MNFADVMQDAIVGSTMSGIVWIVFNSVRRFLTAKTQAGVAQKIFERIDSSQAFVDLAASDSGRQFLESLTLERAEPAAPHARILNGIQAGIVLFFFGIAMFLLHHFTATYDFAMGLLIFGTGAIGLGIGFILASAASLWFSRTLGLLDHDRRG